jgi:NTE family protein
MRPKIGLALGSGAARGWSQIGVLEGLAEFGITPDVVAGSSIGALVGAAFATGRLAALKARLENFGKRHTAALLDVHFTTGGLIEGRRIDNWLQELGIAGDIEAVPMRYGAVATDLSSGREIWLQKGPIGRAVRASIGMPGIFSPAKCGDSDGWLIDGGLVNPVPVSLARALGADIVIAVDLNSQLVGRGFVDSDTDAVPPVIPPAIPTEAPRWLRDAISPILERVFQAPADSPSYFAVLVNSLNIMQDRITRMRLAGDPPEILLCPRLREFSWLDFHRAPEAIAEGRSCVEAAQQEIRLTCRAAVPTKGAAKSRQ